MAFLRRASPEEQVMQQQMALQQQQQQQQMLRPNLVYPSQVKDYDAEELANLVKLLVKYSDILEILRRELRGEALIEDSNGNPTWVQTTKPTFIISDPATRKPKVKIHPFFGSPRIEYQVNDEAIDELISQLRHMGINSITPLTNIDENNIIDDLREFEMKLAALLCLKQVEWGLDKELMPMLMTKVKTLVQDARYVAKDGNLLRALMKSVQRVEQSIEQQRQPGLGIFKGRSPFS